VYGSRQYVYGDDPNDQKYFWNTDDCPHTARDAGVDPD
jgi:hypothetical protein